MHSMDKNDLCELWHKRMAYFHHRDLNILRDIVTGDTRLHHRAPGGVQGVCSLEVHQDLFSKQ